MSRSSRRKGSEQIGGECDRAQTEPIAALVAVLAIAIGLGLYAGVAADRSPESNGETDAEATMQRITAEVLEDGVYDEGDRFVFTGRYARPGESVRVTVEWGGRSRMLWGPSPPPDADVARRPVTVRTKSGEQYAGQLVVEVWES